MLTSQPPDPTGKRSAAGEPRPEASAAASNPAAAQTGPSTAAVHAGEARQKPGFSITDPIFASSTYTFPDTQSIIDFIDVKHPR
jgi:hypothetical protein